MVRLETISTVGAKRLSGILAALAAGIPEPEPPAAVPRGGTLCIHAHDTGELAFGGLTCRGHRIGCRKMRMTTYAANCRPDKCNFYEEEP